MKTENIFLSLASVAIGGKIGLIPDSTAKKEINKPWLDRKIPTCQGFQFDGVHTKDASAGDITVYAVGDLGSVPAAWLSSAKRIPNSGRAPINF